MKRNSKTGIGIIASVIAMLSWSAVASSQTPTATPTPAVQDPSNPPTPRDEFRQAFAKYNDDLEKLGTDLSKVSKDLDQQSTATVESRKAEVDAFRARLVELGKTLQPDAPLAQAIQKYESWVNAQIGRLNSMRDTLGPDYVDKRLQGYKANLDQVSKARATLDGEAKQVDSLLRDLTISEMRMSEDLLAEDADAAVKELNDTLVKLNATFDEIRTTIQQFGTAGV